jgi:hypothetical protein
VADEIRKIRIVQPPFGEAPLWVREAWVGIDLPLVREGGPRKYLVTGVITGSNTFWQLVWAWMRGRTFLIAGYPVRTEAAIELLSATAPAAADWWRENAPHLLRGILIFDEPACRPLSSGTDAVEKSVAVL